MKVLLSIKPEFAEKILNGEKQFEFRRTMFKNKAVKTVVIYASSPVKKILGEFEIDEIIHEDVDALWTKTQQYAGISWEFFKGYFNEKPTGFAIKVKNVKKYSTPKCIKDTYNVVPPQSFLYIR